MISKAQQKRFEEAKKKIITLDERERIGIGMQNEKTVHAILKNTKDPDESHQEVPITGKFIADICNGKKIIEIQSANFGSLWPKLETLLPKYQVTLVYPIPHKKTIVWIDPDTGEEVQRNKSTHTGSYYHAFKELTKIRPLLNHKNLLIDLILIDLEEYKIMDGWSRDKKRGSHRFDRIPNALYDERIFKKQADYRFFVPQSIQNLPEGETFTSKDFAKAVGIKEKSINYSAILLVLTELGVVERVGVGPRRSYLYRYAMEKTTDTAK